MTVRPIVFDVAGQITMTPVESGHCGGAAASALLLDETGIGSAMGAYSAARKLRDDYAGSAIRVRRSSDSTEQDIGFVDNALDESSLTTFVGANDGYVVTVYDQSGNGRDVTQATTTNQCKVVAAGTVNKVNGKPALAVADTTDKYIYAGSPITATDVATLMAVCQTGPGDGQSDMKVVICAGDAANYETIGLSYGNYATAADRRKPALSMRGITTGATSLNANTNQALIVGVTNGTSGKLYEDDLTAETVTWSNPLAANEDSVWLMVWSTGAGLHMADGYFQEAVIWLSDIDSEVSTIKSNTNAFYSIY